MRFRIQQEFAATPSELVAAFCDAGYLAAMAELPDLGAPVLEEQRRSAHVVHQRLRYSFQGKLPAPVLRVIDPEKLTWHELAEIDTDAQRATFRMVPIHYQRFFTCSGGWSLHSPTHVTTVRTIEGELKVNSPVPFVGGQVERAIVSGLKERLAEEPRLYARWSSAR